MAKKRQNNTALPEKASPAPAAGYAPACPQTRKRKRRKNKKKKKIDQMEEEEKKQYLVLRHAARDPSYSLVELNHTLKTAEHLVPFPNRVASFDGEFNMGFAAMCPSDGRRSWIVGVGGFPGRVGDGGPLDSADTIVFDCKTAAVAKGPPPLSPKYLPLAFAVGDRVYALSRMPSIWVPFDAPPWFEVLDLSNASFAAAAAGGGGQRRLTGCGSWRVLQPPPLFPALPGEEELDQLDHAPWTARIESYAVLGRRYILLSAAAGGPVAGTVAFDVSAEEWHFVDREKSLPFVGEGVPYGRRLFLGRSRSKESRDLTTYDIRLRKKVKGRDWTMAITEVPLTIVMADDSPAISRQLFSCLGNGVLCGTGCLNEGMPHDHEIDDDELHVHLYRPVVSAEEGDEAGAQKQVGTVLSSEGSWYILRLHEPLIRLVTPTLVAAPCVAI